MEITVDCIVVPQRKTGLFLAQSEQFPNIEAVGRTREEAAIELKRAIEVWLGILKRAQGIAS